MLRWVCFIVSFTTVPFSIVANAQDLEAGRTKSQLCIACHGDAGISPNELWPNIAGQKKQYMVLQMKAFKSGTRHNDLMSPITQILSDQDIENLSAYYASLKGESP